MSCSKKRFLEVQEALGSSILELLAIFSRSCKIELPALFYSFCILSFSNRASRKRWVRMDWWVRLGSSQMSQSSMCLSHRKRWRSVRRQWRPWKPWSLRRKNHPKSDGDLRILPKHDGKRFFPWALFFFWYHSRKNKIELCFEMCVFFFLLIQLNMQSTTEKVIEKKLQTFKVSYFIFRSFRLS